MYGVMYGYLCNIIRGFCNQPYIKPYIRCAIMYGSNPYMFEQSDVRILYNCKFVKYPKPN